MAIYKKVKLFYILLYISKRSIYCFTFLVARGSQKFINQVCTIKQKIQIIINFIKNIFLVKNFCYIEMYAVENI